MPRPAFLWCSGGAPLVNEPIIGTDDNNLSGLVNTPANCNHFAEGVCAPSLPFLHADQTLYFIHSCVQGRMCLLFFQMGTAFSLFSFFIS